MVNHLWFEYFTIYGLLPFIDTQELYHLCGNFLEEQIHANNSQAGGSAVDFPVG